MMLPMRGISAHRGGAATHPENTLAAFRNAIALGAHQIEFDVRRSADDEIVVIHDASVDRTTNGRGKVARQKLAKLRALDAGGWKAPRFADEPIPTLEQALDAMPKDIWINLQIKKNEPIAAQVAECVVEHGRLSQVIVACGNAAARTAKSVEPGIQICNLARQNTRAGYVEHAISSGSDCVQFHHLRGAPEPELVERAKAAGLHVNYFCDPAGCNLVPLFDAGVDFAIVDDIAAALEGVRGIGIRPLPRPAAG